MTIDENRKIQFQGVVGHLESEREEAHREVAELQRKLRELDNAIITLRQRLDPDTKRKLPQDTTPKYSPDQKYAFISVHWAILHLLSESAAPMTTAEIAEALKNGGVRTRAANFTNNVSAVLSANMRPSGEEEVEMADGAWSLTAMGRNKAEAVVSSPKFLNSCPWAR